MSAVVIMRGVISDPPNPPREYANGTQDGDGGSIPETVTYTFLPAAGFPWADVQEDPSTPTTIPFTQDVQIDVPDVGNAEIVAAYDGAYSTRGPIVPFGYEVSGGLYGDQALGRTMRFQNMGPESYDVNGVQEPSWGDELAARIAANGQGQVTQAEYTTSLLQAI